MMVLLIDEFLKMGGAGSYDPEFFPLTPRNQWQLIDLEWVQ